MALITCAECGKDVSDQASACPQCGAPIGGAVTPPTKRKWVIRAAIVAALVVVAAVVVGAVVMAQNRAAEARAAEASARASETKEVIDSVKAVDSAVTIGINYQDYSAEVRDALAAVDSFEPKSSAQTEVKNALLDAVACYDAANDAWTLDVRDEWYGKDANEPVYWTAMGGYPDKFTELIKGEESVSADDVRQAAWLAAQQYINAAEAAAAE